MDADTFVAPKPSIFLIPNDKVTENDVISGAGGREHPGTKHFLSMCAEARGHYLDPNTRRKEKTKIINAIVREVYKSDPPGRFLKEASGGWSEIGYEKARSMTQKVLNARADDGGTDDAEEHGTEALDARIILLDSKSEQLEQIIYTIYFMSRYWILFGLCLFVAISSWWNARRHFGLDGETIARDVGMDMALLTFVAAYSSRVLEVYGNEDDFMAQQRFAISLGMFLCFFFGAGGIVGIYSCVTNTCSPV